MEGAAAAPEEPEVKSSSDVLRPLSTTLEMIKFSHTLFALPFALLAAVLAAGGIPDAATLAKILLAMVGARSAAMNTGIAGAKDAVRMARAMRDAVRAGRDAFLAGRIPRKRYATASSPVEGIIGR